MNEDKMRAALRGKIDSFDRWKEVCKEAGIRPGDIGEYYSRPRADYALNWGGMNYVGHFNGLEIEQSWWIDRENLRMRLGVYTPPTDVTDKVIQTFRLGYYFIHTSRTDPALLAYTPSLEYGLADRQVHLAFGKLMRKLLLLATDTHIQRMEAAHRSELDPHFEVARTAEDIQRVYTQMAGDTGCMRYSPDNWGLPENLHPSQVYAYAGLGVAYTQIDGRIMSRSVIYENPDDPKDKRYVRIYGDGSLRRKLELAGFRMDSLAGAKLKAIDLHEVNARKWRKDMHLVPYLDGPGGSQGHPAAYVYRIKGEDCVRVITDQQANRLMSMGYTVGHAKQTSAMMQISQVDPDKLVFTCGLTGAQVNTLDTEAVWIYHDGQVKRAATSEVQRTAPELLDVSFYHWLGEDDAITSVLCSYDTREKVCFVDNHYHGGYVLDTPANRKRCGFVQLLASMYGENQWVHESEAVCENPDEADQVWYRKRDCQVVFNEEGTQCWMPQAKLDALREAAPKDYVSVAPRGSLKAVSHVRNPNLVMTLGKRRCVQDWHDVTQLIDGSWDYSQNVREVYILGQPFSVSSKQVQAVRDMRIEESVLRARLASYVENAKIHGRRNREAMVPRLTDLMANMLRKGVENHSFFLKGEMLFRGHVWDGAGTFDQMRAAVAKLAAIDDQVLSDTLSPEYVPLARCWQHHADIVFRLYDEAVAEWTGAQQTTVDRAQVDELLTVTAVHIRDERFAAAA